MKTTTKTMPKSCWDCAYLGVDVSGDGRHEPLEYEPYCKANNDLIGTGEFVSITDEEWDEWLATNPTLNQDAEFIASRCTKYELIQPEEVSNEALHSWS